MTELAQEMVCDEVENVTERKLKNKSKKKNSIKKKKSSSSSSSLSVQFPFRETMSKLVSVVQDPIKGRGLIAKTALEPGTLFWCEKAICSIGHDNESLCTTCGTFLNRQTSHYDDSLPHEAFCSAHCLEAVHKSPETYEYFKLLNESIPRIASERDCDKDLLRMVFHLLHWESQQIIPTDSELQQQLSPSTSTTQPLMTTLTESCSTTSSNSSSSNNHNVIQSTVFGLAALETHMEQQSPEWVACVRGAICDLVALLSTETLSRFTSVIQALGNRTNNKANAATTTTTDCGVESSTALHPEESVGNHGSEPSQPQITSSLQTVAEHALNLASTINVNAYGVIDNRPTNSTADMNTESKAVGFAHFPALGLCVNHACFPNTAFTFNNQGWIELRTLRTVKAGQELTVSYVDLFQSTTERRDLLNEKRFFSCTCGRCVGHDLVCEYVKMTTSGTTNNSSVSFACDNGSSKAGKKGKGKSQAVTDDENETVDEYLTAKGTAIIPDIPSLVPVVLADSMLDGLYCEACGPSGVIVSAPLTAATVNSSTSTATEMTSVCLLCRKKYSKADTAASTDHCRNSWSVCKTAAEYAQRGRPAAALLEKWLSDYDPESAHALPATAAGASNSSSAAVMLRRRRCPLQLHPNHAWVTEAYLLLVQHYLHSARHSSSVTSTSTSSSSSECYKSVASILRRVLRTMEAVLPEHHPEVSYLQSELVSALSHEIVTRTSSGSANSAGGGAVPKVVQELRKERKNVLTKAVHARTVAFGADHALTLASRNQLSKA